MKTLKKQFKHLNNYILCLVTIAFLSSSYNIQACSSFMLKTNSEHIFGHNLDIGGHMPGMVFINNRGVQKNGQTWKQLTAVEFNTEPGISWISNYGSVTFNAFGRDLPDGGMNEKGLFVWEMSGVTTFDTVSNRPRLFMAQWIQYQLDNYSSVQEVLNNLPTIGLDGWNWQFFIADKQGETAGIEFIDGAAIVNTKSNMPIPLMCNGRYTDDLSFISEFDGFGGNIEIDLTNKHIPGIVKGAKMIDDYNGSETIVDYGFNILEHISGKVSKWAIIFDVKNRTAYFRTAKYSNIKSFSIDSFDFSNTTAEKILDIQNANLSGDVLTEFIDFNDDDNYQLAKQTAEKLYKVDNFEVSVDTLAARLATAYKNNNSNVVNNIEGIWVGSAEYPTTGEPAIVDWKIVIEKSEGEIVGKITDAAGLLTDTKMNNIILENGIFTFTVFSHGYVFKISATVSNKSIKGIFDISNESRKGNFNVQLSSL